MSMFKPDFNRLRKVLLREGEPDRLPFFEIIVDGKIIDFLTKKGYGAEATVEFFLQQGYDYVMSSFGIPYKNERLVAKDTSAALAKERRAFINEQKGVIGCRRDFDNYPWPEVNTGMFSNINRTVGLLPNGMKTVILAGDGVLESAMNMVGYAPLSLMIYDDPLLVNDIFGKLGTDLVCALRACMENVDTKSVGAVVIGDDFGFNTGTVISLDDIRKYVFPWHKLIVELLQRYEIPAILHSCGRLDDIMPDIIKLGYHARHSFEDNILPVAEAKKRYGNQIAILGGVDMNVLCTSEEGNLRGYVRDIIEKCAPGGGYALGSGNSVANYVPVGNYLAMLDEGRK